MTVAFASDYYDEEASVRSPITYAQLVGITNSGHDHSSWMSSAETYLLNCGEIDDVAKHTGAFTIAAINGYMNVNSYKVFIFGIISADSPTIAKGSQILSGIEAETGDISNRSYFSFFPLSAMCLGTVFYYF